MQKDTETQTETQVEETTLELTPSLRASTRDGMAWAVMIGLGENFISAFGIFLKATTLQIGLLTTLPLFVGALFQLGGVYILQFFRHRRNVIFPLVVVNALSWVPIAALSIFYGPDEHIVWMVIGCVVIYHAAGNFTAPIWSSLIGDLVPADKRGSFFGLRNRLTGLFTFLAVFAAGQILDGSKKYWELRYGFALIFILACLSRLISAYFVTKYDDPKYEIKREHHFSFFQFIRRSPKSNFARFVYFISLVNFAVSLSGPFFAVYMLRGLKLSYFEFTSVSAVFTASQFLTMQHWGRLTDQFGNRRILTVCGFGASLTPLLWIVSGSIYYLFCVQIIAGFVWAGFNLAAANFMYDAVSPPKRARCVAYQAVVNGAFVLVGSVLGSLIVESLPSSIQFGWFEWVPASKLFFIFIISSIFRLVAVILVLPLFKEVRVVPRIKNSELLFRITSIRPLSGVSFGLFPSAKHGAGRGANRNRR